MTLRIGRFSYSNLFPIFYMLEHECDCSGYEFVEGVPSELNRMLRAGEIDISPSSSIEYLKYPELYDHIEGHSISSNGPVGSIILFSKRPIEELGGRNILMTYQSDTSVAMLQIILSKFYGLRCNYQKSREPVSRALQGNDACLLIGDDALSEALNWPDLNKYDLGRIWTEKTGLPFTYALWLVRKESSLSQTVAVNRFRHDLNMAKIRAFSNLNEIAKISPLKSKLSEEELVSYWKNMIDYDFGRAHQQGLALFGSCARELGLI